MSRDSLDEIATGAQEGMDLDGVAIGMSTVNFNINTGEILNVDVEFFSALADFASSCAGDSRASLFNA